MHEPSSLLAVVVVCVNIGATADDARTIVEVGGGIVVVGVRVGATADDARTIVVVGFCVVVICVWVGATADDARAVVKDGRGIVVVCIRVGATRTRAVVAAVNTALVERLARAVVFCGIDVEAQAVLSVQPSTSNSSQTPSPSVSLMQPSQS